MSSSDGGGTKRTLSSSSGEGSPAQNYKRRKMTATSQLTAVASFEGWGRVSSNGDQDEQVDLMGIHDEVWLTNMNQFFPEPVWRKVLGKLTNKADIENCSNASAFFGSFLREKVVLPIVFGILAQRYYDRTNKDESYRETNVESIPLPRCPLLRCRLVSKSWNIGIEHIYRNEDAGHYQMDYDFDEAVNNVLGRNWGCDHFRRESKVVEFLGHFETSHYNSVDQVSKKCPFLGRYVEVLYSCKLHSVENREGFFNRLMEMVDKFGDHVFYFKFWWNDMKSVKLGDHFFIYQKIREMVELMPNLKVLRISYEDHRTEQLVIQALEEEIERNPFPELANLEMIDVNGIPGVFCNHLVQQNRHISRLEIRYGIFNGNCALFIEKLPNLSQLALVDMNNLEHFEAFESYPFVLNLEKFILHLFEFVRWERVFNAINSKLNSETCKLLQLEMPKPTLNAERISVLQDSFYGRIGLVNIERCRVEGRSRFFLDFLLNSKNTLREIRIAVFCDLDHVYAEEKELRDKQVIKFLGCEHNMLHSNIAKELTRLRKLSTIWYEFKLYYIEPNGVMRLGQEKEWY